MDLNLVINAIKAEMKPSMGCTEPVALALAVSRTCEHLDAPAQKLEMLISSNIFKNAYSVQIPNAGTYGIELACVLGTFVFPGGCGHRSAAAEEGTHRSGGSYPAFLYM